MAIQLGTAQSPTSSKAEGKPLLSAKALDFQFNLDRVERSDKNLTIFVWATNKAEYTQYLAFYDKASRYARTTITTRSDTPVEVDQIYLIQGSRKTPSADAYRGIPVEPGSTVTVQFIFKNTSSDNAFISKLNLIPTVGTRSFIRTYRWNSEEVPLRNISVP